MQVDTGYPDQVAYFVISSATYATSTRQEGPACVCVFLQYTPY